MNVSIFLPTGFFFSLTLASLMLGSMTGCGPRGETKSLNEILTIAQTEFAEQLPNAGEVKSNLAKIQNSLELLVNDQSDLNAVSQAAGSVADEMQLLISRAGYTSRPSFTELVNQFRDLRAEASEGSAAANKLKLIATRTYGALASELATTKFTVLPLSPAVPAN